MFSTVKLRGLRLFLLLAFLLSCITAKAQVNQGGGGNIRTTNAPFAGAVLNTDGTKYYWAIVTAVATNAVSAINGNGSNQQWIVRWTATETSNNWGIQSASGAGGATNFIHIPTADLTHSGLLLSNEWTTFNNIAATNYNANQFTISSKIVAIKIGAITTNGIVWVTNFNASLYQQPHWTSDPTSPDRPQLVTSNGIPILTVRYTNDIQGGLHSILYLGGGNTVNDADKRFEGIHMEMPNILDLNSDSNYVGMAMNFADIFTYGMHQYRFIFEDPPGTSGQINYNAISTDPLFKSLNYGDAFTLTKLQGRDMLLNTTVRSFGISNVVINQTASSTANALAKFTSTAGNIVQNSGLIALSDNSLYVPGTLTNVSQVFSGSIVTNTFLYLGYGGVVSTGTFGSGLTWSGGNLTASAGAPGIETNSVSVGAKSTINLIAGTGVTFLATNNASKVDIQVNSTGGAGTPGGYSTAPQWNQGGSFSGMTNWVYDISNGQLVGTNGGQTPLIKAIGVGIGGVGLNAQGLIQYSNVAMYFGVNGNSNWNITASGHWLPTANVTYDLGAAANQVRSGFFQTATATNYLFKALPLALVSTSLTADGAFGTLFTNQLKDLGTSGGNTNINVAGIQDGQTLLIKIWPTNGVQPILLIGGAAPPVDWYTDKLATGIASNAWNWIYVSRAGATTNITILNPGFVLAAGTAVTFTTNFNADPPTITISSSGGGGGGPFNVSQFAASSTHTNIKDGAITTNLNNSGTLNLTNPPGAQATLKLWQSNGLAYTEFKLPPVGPTNSITWAYTNVQAGQYPKFIAASVGSGVAAITVSNDFFNQVIYNAEEYNGTNASVAPLTNQWDMTSSAFKPVTNFVSTQLTFVLSNVTKSAAIISEFIGLAGTTNTVLIQAPAGVNIKWKGWNTNVNSGGLLVRGGYSYTFQAFADRATNVSAWVTTDDPYAVGPIISIVTNDLVINTRYTNTASTVSYVQCSMTLNASVTDIAQAVLLIDQDGNGTWDVWITNRIGSGVAMADSILMGGWVTNSGIFLITNQSTGSATATINPNSSQRISGFGTGPQGLTGPAGVQAFNSLPQAQTNYLPAYDRRMAWGSLSPNNGVSPMVSQGTLGNVNLTGTAQNDVPPSATNSHYGVIRATGGTIGATIVPASATLFEPTNHVFQFTATLGFSNAPGTNEMHCGLINNNVFSFADTSAHIGWFAETKGTSQTNWLAQYKSNNTAAITVYTGTTNEMTGQWHTLGIANTNGNTLVWYMDGVPVATLTTPGLASPGGFGAIPVIGQRVTLSPNGTNFLFWQDFELLHEKTLPVSTGPL